MYLVGFIIRIYHSARSSECQISVANGWVTLLLAPSLCDRQRSEIKVESVAQGHANGSNYTQP